MQIVASKAAETGSGVTRPASLIVLIDGQVRTDLWVRRLVLDGALDERDVELSAVPVDSGFSVDQRRVMAQLRNTALTVLTPVGLDGGEARLLPMFQGRITQIGQTLDGKRDQWAVTGRCDWSLLLDESVGDVADVQALSAQLDLSNASVAAGQTLHGRTMRSVTQAICDKAGLVVQRRMQWAGGSVREQRRWLPRKFGRPVAIAGGLLSDSAGAVEALRGVLSSNGPMKLIARTGPQEVESTFVLTAGWLAGDEGKADAEYVKSTSSDFDAVANVYRTWVLNEDGIYGLPAFDLSALFADGLPMAGQTVRFHGCLTRDEADRPLGVVVEISTDGGTHWKRYSGRLTVMSDRAGVYLEDDALPPDFLNAAKTGQARLRVTATVSSAWPTLRVRWVGNPFAGRFEEQTFDVSDSFAWRRVDATSRYAQAVETGQRLADVVDDRVRMETWLAERAGLLSVGASAQVTMTTTTQVMPGWRPGDRLTAMAGWEIGATLDDPSIHRSRPQVWLSRIEHRWNSPVGSTLTWRV